MPGPFEREHARRFETQHVALRVEEELELRRQLDLVHDDALARELLCGGLDRSDGCGFGVAPRGRPPEAHTRGTDSFEWRRAGVVPLDHADHHRAIVHTSRKEPDRVEAPGEWLHPGRIDRVE